MVDHPVKNVPVPKVLAIGQPIVRAFEMQHAVPFQGAGHIARPLEIAVCRAARRLTRRLEDDVIPHVAQDGLYLCRRGRIREGTRQVQLRRNGGNPFIRADSAHLVAVMDLRAGPAIQLADIRAQPVQVLPAHLRAF